MRYERHQPGLGDLNILGRAAGPAHLVVERGQILSTYTKAQ